MSHFENTLVRKRLPEVHNDVEIGTVPFTKGVPSQAPTPDQLPFAYDSSTGILYFYTTEWKPFGLNALKEVDLSNITNLDNVLRVPVSYTTGATQVEGYLTLKEFKKL